MEVDTSEPEYLVQETCVQDRLHKQLLSHSYPFQRLRYDFPSEIGQMVPMTPPEMWGTWRGHVLVSPLPVTSPGTPEGPPPMTPPEAFFPGTPPGPPPPGALPATPPEAFWSVTPRGMLGGG